MLTEIDAKKIMEEEKNGVFYPNKARLNKVQSYLDKHFKKIEFQLFGVFKHTYDKEGGNYFLTIGYEKIQACVIKFCEREPLTKYKVLFSRTKESEIKEMLELAIKASCEKKKK